MGLPGLLIDIVGSGPVTTLDTAVATDYGRGPMTTLDTARQMSLMIDGVAWTHRCSRRGRGPVTTLDTAR